MWNKSQLTLQYPYWLALGKYHTCEILTHWGLVTYIYIYIYTSVIRQLLVHKMACQLSPVQRRAIIWTNAESSLIRLLVTLFGEIWIKIQQFAFKKIHLKCRLHNGHHFVSDTSNLMLMQSSPIVCLPPCSWNLMFLTPSYFVLLNWVCWTPNEIQPKNYVCVCALL